MKNTKTRLIIAGGRDFDDYNLLRDSALSFMKQNDIDPTEMVIISGAAPGADTLGEKFAQEQNILVKKFPADWKKYGRSAGPIRNRQMAEFGTHCIVFWDGQSRGTKNMINQCEQVKIPCKIVKFTR